MSSPFQAPSEFQPQRRRRVWPLVASGCAAVGVLMVAACGGLLYFGYSQVTGEGEVAVEVDRFFNEISQGHADAYYQRQTSSELRNVTSEKDFLGICKTIEERLGRLQTKSMSGFKVRNQNLTAYVDADYDCQFERGKGLVKTTFKRENGQWMLLGFHVDSPELLKAIAHEKCPHCGQPYEAGAKFCPHCGKAIAP